MKKVIQFEHTLLFKKSSIAFEIIQNGDSLEATCRASINLPIFKQTMVGRTLLLKNYEWKEHEPLQSENAEIKKIFCTKDLQSQGLMDPITFFLKVDSGAWEEGEARVLIGDRRATLSTKKIKNEWQLERPEKSQKMFVGMSDRGIEYFRIPLPVLGEIKINRKI